MSLELRGGRDGKGCEREGKSKLSGGRSCSDIYRHVGFKRGEASGEWRPPGSAARKGKIALGACSS